MFLTFALAAAFAVSPSDTVPTSAQQAQPADSLAAPAVVQPTAVQPAALSAVLPDQPVGIGAPSVPEDTTPRRRRHAVEISDAYAVRLKIHQIASYTTLPLFAAQAIVGQQLYVAEQNGNRPSDNLRVTHDAVAVALGGLFVVNSVTGGWNWWETRHNAEGRTWRTIHAALMLISDGGFAYTAWLGQGAHYYGGSNAGRNTHKNWAIGSASVALVSYAMMLKPFRQD